MNEIYNTQNTLNTQRTLIRTLRCIFQTLYKFLPNMKIKKYLTSIIIQLKNMDTMEQVKGGLKFERIQNHLYTFA